MEEIEKQICPTCSKDFVPNAPIGRQRGLQQVFCSKECRINFYKKSNVCPRCGKNICLNSYLCRTCRGKERAKHKRIKEIVEKSQPICLFCRIPLSRVTSFCGTSHRNLWFKVRDRINYYCENSVEEIQKLRQLGKDYRFTGFPDADLLNDLYFGTDLTKREVYVEVELERKNNEND